MAIDPINNIPDRLYAGDTWFFELTDSTYPAGTWNLVTYFSSCAGKFSATAAQNGTAHRFTVTAATTAGYEPGGYNYQIRAEHGSDGRKFTIGEGFVDVLPPLSQQADHRHRVKKILDAIDAVIENRATSDHLAVSVAGRSISKMGINELRDFRAWYSQQWDILRGKQRQVAFGKDRGRQVRARFT